MTSVCVYESNHDHVSHDVLSFGSSVYTLLFVAHKVIHIEDVFVINIESCSQYSLVSVNVVVHENVLITCNEISLTVFVVAYVCDIMLFKKV